MAEITIRDLTEATVSGAGVFDVVMKAVTAHLDEQYKQGRIRGPEYATVYVNSLQASLQQSLQFLLARERTEKEIELLAAQIVKEGAATANINAETDLVKAQEIKIGFEGELVQAQQANALEENNVLRNTAARIEQERLLLVANTAKAGEDKLLVSKQVLTEGSVKSKLDAEKLLIEAQVPKINADILLSGAQKSLTEQEKLKTAAEVLNLPKQGERLDAEVALLDKQALTEVQQTLRVTAETDKLEQEKTNLVKQEKVLAAQECKLKAEYDMILKQVIKIASEAALLDQKKVTESAQTSGGIAAADSTLGRQNNLFLNQANGFIRDAEQKAAKMLIDSWTVRRTTDPDATAANTANGLSDANIKRALDKLLLGVDA